jgi:hypothetical protein
MADIDIQDLTSSQPNSNSRARYRAPERHCRAHPPAVPRLESFGKQNRMSGYTCGGECNIASWPARVKPFTERLVNQLADAAPKGGMEAWLFGPDALGRVGPCPACKPVHRSSIGRGSRYRRRIWSILLESEVRTLSTGFRACKQLSGVVFMVRPPAWRPRFASVARADVDSMSHQDRISNWD